MTNRAASNGCLLSIGSISLIMCITIGAVLFITDLERPDTLLGVVGYILVYLVALIIAIPALIYFALTGAAGVPVGPEYVRDHLIFWAMLPFALFFLRELIPRIPVVGSTLEHYMLNLYGWITARLTFQPFDAEIEINPSLPRSKTALKREVRRQELAAQLANVLADNKRMKAWLEQRNIQH